METALVEHLFQRCAGAYEALLGGLDAFVFIAGNGEHSAPVRAALCDRLAWLGVKLDAQANAAAASRVSTADGSFPQKRN